MALTLIHHPDGLHRCSWCGQGEALADYVHYHDHEWGMPVADENRLFEKITLEGFQSGLSWLTVLRKREHFRKVFKGFDFEKIARFGDKDIERLVLDAGIIRHRGKIASAINNAQRICELMDKQGLGALARLVWSHEPAVQPKPGTAQSQTPESQALSKTFKKMGFSFVGPTTMYAFMQSMGVVNDHLKGCHHRAVVDAARKDFKRPA